MTDEEKPFTPPRGTYVLTGIVIAVIGAAILTAIASSGRAGEATVYMTAGLETFSRLLGAVTAIVGVAYFAGIGRTTSPEELRLTVWTGAVVFLCGATLLSGGSWGAPLGVGLAFVAAAIAGRRGDRNPGGPGTPDSPSSHG